MTKIKQFRDPQLVTDGSIVGFYPREFYVFDNFASFQVDWHGHRWPTSEHAYQAAHFFETAPELAEEIKQARSAHDAYKIAKANADKAPANWHDIKIGIMEEIVRAKCEQNPYVKQKLMESLDEIIVEDSPKDDFWGWGEKRDGRNELGKIWMKLREEIRNKEERNSTASNGIDNLIKIITDGDFDENAPDFDEGKSWKREAVRAILVGADGKVALMHARKYDYYKLPGGGIEAGEDHEMALRRELLEEVGAEARVMGEVGKIEEKRAFADNMHQISYTYTAEVVGETGENDLDDGERAEDFQPVWVGLDEAIRLVKSGNRTTDKGLGQRFMALRDELFLREYKKQLEENMKGENK